MESSVSADTFVIGSASQVGRFVLFLKSLTFERPWKVTIERVEPRRSIPQNDKLRAMEREIAQTTGHDPDELHEILLARHFGTQRVELGGGKFINRPALRSSDLTRAQMGDYITWVHAFAAEHLGMELE
jgi:hypothetical protein